MTRSLISWCRTRAEIGLWRHGWAWPLSALGAGCALFAHILVLQPDLAARDDARKALLLEAQRQAAPASKAQPVPSQLEQPLRTLQAALSPSHESDALVRRMAALAQAEQIALSQGEYQQQVNTVIGVTRVQVSQPVRASYPQLRRYIEAVLKVIPNASLDQVIASRDNVGQLQIEARLKWSLWTTTSQQLVKPGSSNKEVTP